MNALFSLEHFHILMFVYEYLILYIIAHKIDYSYQVQVKKKKRGLPWNVENIVMIYGAEEEFLWLGLIFDIVRKF